MRNCRATCTLGEIQLAVVPRKVPCLIRKSPKTIAGFPARRQVRDKSQRRSHCRCIRAGLAGHKYFKQ
eukprot:1129198-Pyramimonas_sp.AAC.1